MDKSCLGSRVVTLTSEKVMGLLGLSSPSSLISVVRTTSFKVFGVDMLLVLQVRFGKSIFDNFALF